MATFSKSLIITEETRELPEIHERAGPLCRPRGVPTADNAHLPRELLATLCEGPETPWGGRHQRKERAVRTTGSCGQRGERQHSPRQGVQNGQGSDPGPGRDVSFMGDSTAAQTKRRTLPPMGAQAKDVGVVESLIPEEYHVVKQQGVLEFCSQFTSEGLDDGPPPRLFPSLRPSGRWEVVQVMGVMEDMMQKAGLDRQPEELADLSQMEALVELLKVEQNIYSVVFHELIRQVSVNCAERGLLLNRIRQQYVSLLERVPRQVKNIHSAALAERALNQRLTQEVVHFKTSIQNLSTELSEIKSHDEIISKQARQAQQDLTEALDQATKNADLLQEYHKLYELQRRRLQSQMETVSEERNLWRADTFSLTAKVISLGKLQLFHRLHVAANCWSKTARQYAAVISAKDMEQMNVILRLTDSWRERHACFMERLRATERPQCDLIQAVQQGVARRYGVSTATNRSPAPKYEKVSEIEVHTELMQWTNMLTVQCERYSGETLLCFQDHLGALRGMQGSWAEAALRVFHRHPGPEGAPPRGQGVLEDLDRLVSGLTGQLETCVNGENGLHQLSMSLVRPMEVWAERLRTAADQSDTIPASDWLKLQNALSDWQSLAEEILQRVSSSQSEDERAQKKPHVEVKSADVLDALRGFVTSQSRFLNDENTRLCDQVSSLHTSLVRWMVALLVLMVPDQEHDREAQDRSPSEAGGLDHMERDARDLVQELERLTRDLSRSCLLVVDEDLLENVLADSQVYEHGKLQQECSDWTETCWLLLLDVKRGSVDLSINLPPASCHPNPASRQLPDPDSNQAHPDRQQCRPSPNQPSPASNPSIGDHELRPSPASSQNSLGGTAAHEEEEQEDGDGADKGSASVVKMIGHDGFITQRTLPESWSELDTAEGAPEGSLSTVDLLQRELQASVLQLQLCEQRAVSAEEALQGALLQIRLLENRLEDQALAEPAAEEEERADSACTEENTTQLELTQAAPKKPSSRTKPSPRRSKRHGLISM